jgi:hypothetical protein
MQKAEKKPILHHLRGSSGWALEWVTSRGFARFFCILHSSFYLHFGVAFGWLPTSLLHRCRWLAGGFRVPILWLSGGFSRASRAIPQSAIRIPRSPQGGFGWLCPDFFILHPPFYLRFRVALSVLAGRSPPQTYKKPESICPDSPASRCPPTGLVPPWSYPIPIQPPPNAFFDQASLSRSPSRTFSRPA